MPQQSQGHRQGYKIQRLQPVQSRSIRMAVQARQRQMSLRTATVICNSAFGIPVGERGPEGPQGKPGDGLNYKGAIDATTAAEPVDPSNGDFYVNTVDGTSSWTGLAPSVMAPGSFGTATPTSGTPTRLLTQQTLITRKLQTRARFEHQRNRRCSSVSYVGPCGLNDPDRERKA